MIESWQVNITLIPSIAVVLTSTNRMALGLTDEINLRLVQNLAAFKEILPLKIKQLKRLSLAIILMYIALALLVINALTGALEILEAPLDMILIIAAITIFMIALFLKIQFSYKAYKIRQIQFLSFLK